MTRIQGIRDFIECLYKHFIANRCPQTAASLAYATLLALIPSTVLVYKLFASLAVLPDWGERAQEFVFHILSPAVGDHVRQYMLKTAMQATGLNVLGLLMLLVSVILVMYTIDAALNNIWQIHRPRYLVRRVLVYLAILIFGPIAIAFSLFLSTYLASLPVLAQIFGHTVDEKTILAWLPFLVTLVAFTILYQWVPDAKVRLLHSVIGGLIAALLFEIAKRGFTLYVSYFPTYELLYGALASIPLLLIWIYLTWLIVLVGGEITHCLWLKEEAETFVSEVVITSEQPPQTTNGHEDSL